MRWLRSWPAVVPPGRAHVVDDMERLVISDYDYSRLAVYDDDVCLLEWDMALSLEGRLDFERVARALPDVVIVAPYRLYTPTPAHWAHRRIGMMADKSERWIMTNEGGADYVGFGCIYLPRDAVRGFLAAEAPERGRPPNVAPGDYADSRFTDQTFSVWHRHRHMGGRLSRVVWEVHPVHLHY